MLSYPLLAALVGMLAAQIIKIPLHFIAVREFKPSLAFSTGGMPSSHTATIVGVTTAVGLVEGFQSTVFAISLVMTAIVMHDATGVRRHAGRHAEILNQLLGDFNTIIGTLKHEDIRKLETREKLKELLGHKPIEVFFGALLGIVVALILYRIYYNQ